MRPRGRPKFSTGKSAPLTYSAPILAEFCVCRVAGQADGESAELSLRASDLDHHRRYWRPIPARVTRHDKPSKSDESPRTLPSLEALQPEIVTNAPSTQSSSDTEGSQVRQRKILGRYVFGNDLKPGERWKRRLPKGALR